MVIAKIKAWLYGALALIGAIIGAYMLGAFKGRSAARTERLENELDDMKEAYDVQHEIGGLDPDAVNARLDKWMRD